MSLDNTIWLAYILTEAAVVGLLIYRRMWRLLPVFCIYCVWDLLSNATSFTSRQFFPSAYNGWSYLFQTVIDSVLEFGVLVELAWSVLRPIRPFLRRGSLAAVAALIILLGVLVWPLVSLQALSDLPPLFLFLLRLQLTVSILRILVFVVLAGFSQWLSIGWRDRELQIATGLGLYSLVSLAVTMVQVRLTAPTQYAYLNQYAIGGFLCALLYWVFSFAQKQAERREFTPQMQNLLLAVAGVARENRAALTESTIKKNEARQKP